MKLQVLKNGSTVEVDQVENVYCPTGQGGGVDPTCKRGGKGGKSTSGSKGGAEGKSKSTGDPLKVGRSLAGRYGGDVFDPVDGIATIEFAGSKNKYGNITEASRKKARNGLGKFLDDARKKGLSVQSGGEMEFGIFRADLFV